MNRRFDEAHLVVGKGLGPRDGMERMFEFLTQLASKTAADKATQPEFMCRPDIMRGSTKIRVRITEEIFERR